MLAALIVVLFWAALPFLRVEARQPATQADPQPVSDTQPPQTTCTESAAQTSAQVSFDRWFLLPVLQDGEVVRMELHTYLTGVLLAEMPASFADEALKAQAVASRTYSLRSDSHRRHAGAAVCTSSACCQGWQDPDSAAPEARARAEAAVSATDGLVICYQGALIDATFFSCSGGQTEAAAAVWGSDLPYLQAVESPGEEAASHYTDETRIPLSDFRVSLKLS